jgi:sugar lactone lactonase YvrE
LRPANSEIRITSGHYAVSVAAILQPRSIAVDPSGKLLICDIGNHRIRQVDFSPGVIETYGQNA